jgi:hypothetical protein
MPTAKDIRLAPISGRDGDNLIRRLHYSGKVVNNSFLHLGVFLDGKLEGAIQIGHSMDKGKLITLVRDTPWNGFAEINRMAFSERLPRNSESRAIGIAMRTLRQRAPHLQWIISFADATCCGDGTIYRASGFVLSGITKNSTLLIMPDGSRIANLTLTANWNIPQVAELSRKLGAEHRYRPISEWLALGAKWAPGFQLRYLYFLDPTARDRLTVPILPFSTIDEIGAAMYRGQARDKQAMAGHHPAQRRGSTDHRAPTTDDQKGRQSGGPSEVVAA